MSREPPIFSKNAVEGIEIRTDNPLVTLIISIEPNPHLKASFWKDDLLLSAMNANFLIVRLFETSDTYEITNFSEIYDVPPAPCLFYFVPNEEEPTVFRRYPTVDELHGFIISHDPSFAKPREKASSVRRNAKLSVEFGGRRVSREFPANAKLGDVRTWIAEEFGTGFAIRVVHTRQLLPEDAEMTVTAAGLAPSAMLVLEKDGATLADEELPDLPRAEILGDVGSDGDDEVVVAETRCTWKKVLETIMGLVNPFSDAVEVEDFFETKED